MTNRTPYALLALMVATAAAGQENDALHYLKETRDALFASVKGLTPAQWDFKPAPDRWSIAQIVEHITVTDELVVELEARLSQAPAPAAGFNSQAVDAMILAKMTDRTVKAQAPAELQPASRWTPAAALEHFTAACHTLAADLRDPSELRRHVVPHPAFGPLDGYEWVLAAAGHTARHTRQILEVRADPNFPR